MNEKWTTPFAGHAEDLSSSKGKKEEEKMKRLRWIWQGDVYLKAVVLLAVMTSVVSFVYFYNTGIITAYGDAQSRLMIARRVVDGLHTGLAQLGGVWPPIPQIFMVPLIWNDFLYTSGIAGAVVSMVSYVVAVVFLYKLVVSVTEDRAAGLISAIAFSNPNILYMQSVPMSEMPFIAFFVMSIYFLMRWVQDVEKLRFLFLTALAVSLATLTRYEGWVLLLVVTAVIVCVFRKNRFSYAKAEGHFVFFATLALFGVGLWFIWNQVIYKDTLYFLTSEYAERSQFMEGQITEGGNFPLSFLVYGWAVLDNTGWITTTLGCVGLVYLIFARGRPSTQKLVALSLVFPFGFYVFALFKGGIVLLQVPQLMPDAYQNIRYGLFMIPAVGFFVGVLVQKGRSWLKLSVLVLVVVSAVVTWQGGLVSFKEAFHDKVTIGTSPQDIAGHWLKDYYDEGLVLMAVKGNEPAAFVFSSEASLSKVIYEGDQDIWEESLQDPTKHAQWVFMRSETTPDKVWKALHGTPQLLDNYDLVYQNGDIEIYKRKAD